MPSQDRSTSRVFASAVVVVAVTTALASTPIPVNQHPAVPSPTLTWQTAAELRVPESVLYVVEQRLLLVPTFFDNRVMAYRLQ